jgi:hypothetical protein
MSKAVLVMDIPNSCDKCPCFCGHYSVKKENFRRR